MTRGTAASLVLLACISGACGAEPTSSAAPAEAAQRLRDEALASARVWAPPAVPIPSADLSVNPPGEPDLSVDRDVECTFTLEPVGGTTPKFYCRMASGDTVKIKYGAANPELSAEVAATRLLAALGFYADRMFVVKGVRCAGCPRFPFQALRCYQQTGIQRTCFPGGIDERTIRYFPVAVVERRLPGSVIEAVDDQGWGWYELERVDPSRGGATRAEVDALRLLAVFLTHWDNKPANQRLICPPGALGSDGRCARPLALMQDLGATFGPLKLDLHNWQRQQIWKDGATCSVSMKHLPWGGGTFPDLRISEEGRRLLLGLLEQLSDQQIRDLFEGSRATVHDQVSAAARNPENWVRAFLDKVRQIRNGGPCPPS